MKKFFLTFCFIPFLGWVQEMQPWLGELYHLYFFSKYTYSHYNKVEGARPNLTHSSNDHLLSFDLDFPFAPSWSSDVEIGFFGTPRHSFHYQTTSLQFRKCLLDDIVGDPLAVTVGGNVRYVSKEDLHDVSTPYHGQGEMQFHVALGKEFSREELWHLRLWGIGFVGQATNGSPWFRGVFTVEGNFDDAHLLGVMLDGMQGYGKKRHLDPHRFDGYGPYRQRILDLAIWYGVRFGSYGSLRVEYKRRLIAKIAPENVNFFSISYLVPFSF